MKYFLLALVFLLALSQSFAVRPFTTTDTSDPLPSIASHINKEKKLSASTTESKDVWSYMLDGLKAAGHAVSNDGLHLNTVSTTMSTNKSGQKQLIVSATATVWGTDNAAIKVVFYVENKKLNFFMQLDLNLGEVPRALVPSTGDAAKWYQGLSLTGANSASISSSTFTDMDGNSYSKGLTLTANVQVNDKAPFKAKLDAITKGGPFAGKLNAQFPLSSTEPVARFHVEITSALNFGSHANIKSENIVVDAVIGTSPELKVSTTLSIKLDVNSDRWLAYAISADLNKATGVEFNGAMQGKWEKVFGLPWLTFTSSNVALASTNARKLTSLSFSGSAEVAFGKVTGSYGMSVDMSTGTPQYDLTLGTTVSSLANMFDAVVGVRPSQITQVIVNGALSLELSNKGDNAGLTLSGSDISISGNGELADAIATMAKFEKKPLSFDMSLFIPVFSAKKSNFALSLKEKNPIRLNEKAYLESILIKFDMDPTPSVTIHTSMNVNIKDNSVVFELSGSFNTPGKLSFSGGMTGSWNKPFGLDWILVSDSKAVLTFDLPTKKINVFSINGNYKFTFLNSVTNIMTVAFKDNFSNYSVSLTAQVDDLSALLTSVTKKNAPALTVGLVYNGVISIADFDSGDVPTGLVISGTVTAPLTSKLAQALHSMDPDTPLSFSIRLFVPVFTPNPKDITVSLSQKATFQVSPAIQMAGFDIQFKLGSAPSTSLASNIIATIGKTNPQALRFALQANLDTTSGITLKGGMTGNWATPLGVKWMTISGLSAAFTIVNKKVTTADLSGSATVTFNRDSHQVAVSISASDDLKDVIVKIEDVSVIGLPQIVKEIAGSAPSELNDVRTVSNKIDLIVSNVDKDDIKSGVTLSDNAVISGDLVKKFKVFNRKQGDMTAAVSVNVPIFSMSKPNVVLDLDVGNITLNDRSILTDLKFEVATLPLAITVKSQFSVTFPKNPTLLFDIYGTLAADSSITLGGDMMGTWNNLFGVQGLSISDVQGMLGFNPALCGIDLCISALGIGSAVTIGSKQFAFYGMAHIPDFTNFYMKASAHNKYGEVVLPFRDITVAWNKMVGPFNPVHLDPSDFPEDWGLLDLEMLIAPQAGTFNNINYEEGFNMAAGFRILGVNCSVDVKVQSGDFHFDFHLTVDNFADMVRRHISMDMMVHPQLYSGWKAEHKRAFLAGETMVQTEAGTQMVIVDIRNVNLTRLACSSLAKKTYPRFSMDYILFNKLHNLTLDVDLIDLYEHFHSFYKKYLWSIWHKESGENLVDLVPYNN